MYLDFDQIVEMALGGNPEAKVEIIHKLKPLIASYSRKYGGLNPWDHEVYQEGAWQILEALEAFDPSRGVPFLGFVKLRLRHYYQNKRRKEKFLISLDEPIEEGEGACLLDLLVDERAFIEAAYLTKEEKDRLRQALKELKAEERQLIVDYYFKGKRLKDIARERNIHHTTASKNKARALGRLKALLSESF